MIKKEFVELLIFEYIKIPKGVFIDLPKEKLHIIDISEGKIFITRRALKHFVESRVSELEKRHSRERILEMLLFAFSNLDDIFESLASATLGKNNRYKICKDYSHVGYPQICCAYERVGSDIEVVSIHFKKIN